MKRIISVWSSNWYGISISSWFNDLQNNRMQSRTQDEAFDANATCQCLYVSKVMVDVRKDGNKKQNLSWQLPFYLHICIFHVGGSLALMATSIYDLWHYKSSTLALDRLNVSETSKLATEVDFLMYYELDPLAQSILQESLNGIVVFLFLLRWIYSLTL